MKLVKINNYVSMYSQPALGSADENTRFMALSVDKSTINKKIKLGLAREITRSQGSVDVPGFIDRSKLIIVKSNDLIKWEKHSDLNIKGIEKIMNKLSGKKQYFIGLEDPDIWIDEKKIKHVYYTIAFKIKGKELYKTYLGHAQGNKLDDLTATKPILGPIGNKICGFKEAAISKGINGKPRFNLLEMGYYENEEWTSIISSVIAKDMSSPWKYNKILLNPLEMKYEWCKGHLSPCCFLHGLKLNTNKDIVACIVNGREPEKIVNNEKVYGKFRPGFILFNKKTGEAPWINSESSFEDPQARTITFASDFIKTGKDRGLIYAHVNDGFVRAYKINLRELEKYLNDRIRINLN